MRIDTHILRELPRALLTLRELSRGVDSGIAKELLVEVCDSVVFYGRRPEYEDIIKAGILAGLVQITNGLLRITPHGNSFLDLNRSGTYGITPEQLSDLTLRLVVSGPYRDLARNVFQQFVVDTKSNRLVLNTAGHRLTSETVACLNMLVALGQIARSGSFYVIDESSLPLAQQLLQERDAVTEDQLLAALEEQRKLGELAENFALEFERLRLRELGRELEASLVRRVSPFNVAAGYDIESFDGSEPSATYDRYIEVKASKGSQLRFFWSRNEYQVARHCGPSYWIYFLGEVGQRDIESLAPVLIQNPARLVKDQDEWIMEPTNYLIRQVGSA